MADEEITTGAAADIAATQFPEPVIETTDEKWASALVVAAGSIPSGEKRGVVVVEVRGDDGSNGQPKSYPQGGDIYYRTEVATDFGNKTTACLTLGDNVQQGMLWGFSYIPGIVHVGPAHPAYAGANLAFQQGAKKIEITGLSPFWKERLLPFFNKLADDPWYPAKDVEITLT